MSKSPYCLSRMSPRERARDPEKSWSMRLLVLAVLCLVMAVELSR